MRPLTISPQAIAFLRALHKDAYAGATRRGAPQKAAIAEATRIAKDFANAMRDGTIESIDGAPCMAETPEPRAPSSRQTRLI